MFKLEENKQKMKNVLKAFSNYDSEISIVNFNPGYVQGMNFIVGFFLYHCEAYVAFWLFVALIEEYNLRDIFIEGNSHYNKVVRVAGSKTSFKNVNKSSSKQLQIRI